jgi:hypothetical protein
MADSPAHRIISRDLPDGGRILAAVTSTDDTGDEELLDRIEADMDRRHLRAVDDPE